MPRYNYVCEDCLQKVGHELTDAEFEELVLFETSHSINPTKKELKEAVCCPRCNSHNCKITIYGASIYGYLKGYGWHDKDGIKRDMNIFTLTQDDPYTEYRVPGEKDDIKDRLERGGKRKSKTQYYGPRTSHKEMVKAVEEVARKSASE